MARKDARKYYKHSVAILVKQIQVKKPRQRVPVLYAINSLCAAGDDDEVKKLFASRFSRDILKCVEAALRCPPQHLAGVKRVVAKWRRRSAFPPPIVAAAAALLDGYAGWDPSLIDKEPLDVRDDDNKDTDGFDVDDYAPSSDECSDGEGEDKGTTAKTTAGRRRCETVTTPPTTKPARRSRTLAAGEGTAGEEGTRVGRGAQEARRPAVRARTGTHAERDPPGRRRSRMSRWRGTRRRRRRRLRQTRLPIRRRRWG